MNLPFTKMQAVGNDFVVVEEAKWPADTDWNAAAIRLCDRRFGIGGDGLLVVGPSKVSDVRMRMFNPDGTEDMCGNGLRCVIRYAHERGLTSAYNGRAETLTGLYYFEARCDASSITVDMGRPEFAPEKLPMTVPGDIVIDYPLAVGDTVVPVTVINTGSTHAVTFVESLPEDATFLALSPQIEHHPLFPERTSVIWTTVSDAWRSDAGPDEVKIRIWERGAGETLGCGTGACAAAIAAIVTKRLLPLPHWRVRVLSKGGELIINWGGMPSDTVGLTGPAETVFTGTVQFDAED